MADESLKQPSVEIIPSETGDVSALASANAPFIYCDGVLIHGFNNGIANVTLIAVRHMAARGKITHDLAVTAHLRMSRQAAANLRDALNQVLLLAEPPAGEKAN
jgi:hypothetical protein